MSRARPYGPRAIEFFLATTQRIPKAFSPQVNLYGPRVMGSSLAKKDPLDVGSWAGLYARPFVLRSIRLLLATT